MKNAAKTATNPNQENSFEFYRSRASQERQMAMKSFFGQFFGRN